MDYQKVSKQIIEIVGGKENITNVYHCMTRIRMTLADTEKVDEGKLSELKEAKGFVYNGSTIQIIIGPSIVDDLTAVVKKDLGMGEDVQTSDEKRSAITIIQSIVMPSVGLLAGTAMFSAIYSILDMLGVSSELPIMMLLTLIPTLLTQGGLPVFFGFNASKTFGGTPYVGAFYGVLLTYGALDGIEIMGITLSNGMGGVVAVVAISIFAAYVERWFKSKLPEILRFIFVPFFTVAISTIALVLVIAPLANILNNALASFMTYAMHSETLIYALLCAALTAVWLLVIMTGLHMAVIMLMIPVAIETGFVPVEPAIGMTMPALLGVATAVFILYRKRSANVQSIGASSIPLIALGISEPTLYGLILPNPRLFFNVGAAGAIAGFIHIMLGNQVTYPNASGVFETFTTTNPLYFVISYAIAFGIGCGLTLILNRSNLKYQ